MAHVAITVFLALAATAIGVLSLAHPVAFWPYGVPHGSDSPPVFGVGLLVVPVFLIGLGIYRAWWALDLDLEAWKEHRARRKEHRS